MSEVATFQRARKPQEQKLRREQILAAAAELFDAHGVQGAGINAIAARAGFTKSNVYRYFESREDVLLDLFLDSFERVLPEFEIAVAICPVGDTARIARAATMVFAAHPRLGQLLAVLATVLEHNVSEEAVIALKRATNVQIHRLAFALHDKLPGTTLEDCAWVASMVGTLIAGMWPSANSSGVAQKVLAMPEFQHLKFSVERDLERAMLALLRSIVHLA